MMSHMLVLALALSGAVGVPLMEERGYTDPECLANVPKTADADTVNKVYLAGLAKGADMRVRLNMLPDGIKTNSFATGRSCRLLLRRASRSRTATT
jgi:hypothetical protein